MEYHEAAFHRGRASDRRHIGVSSSGVHWARVLWFPRLCIPVSPERWTGAACWSGDRNGHWFATIARSVETTQTKPGGDPRLLRLTMDRLLD